MFSFSMLRRLREDSAPIVGVSPTGARSVRDKRSGGFVVAAFHKTNRDRLEWWGFTGDDDANSCFSWVCDLTRAEWFLTESDADRSMGVTFSNGQIQPLEIAVKATQQQLYEGRPVT